MSVSIAHEIIKHSRIYDVQEESAAAVHVYLENCIVAVSIINLPSIEIGKQGTIYDLCQKKTCPQCFKMYTCTVKPVSSDHIKQDIFLAFQTGGCLLLRERCMTFLHYFHSSIHNRLSIAISMSAKWMAASNRFNFRG